MAQNVGTGELLLYGNEMGEEQEYDDLSIVKYLRHINLTAKNILRSSGSIAKPDNQWIIISEKYDINYMSKIVSGVENMPQNQVKFYDETTYITKDIPTTEKYKADIQKLWNTDVDGHGKIYPPGSKYELNEDITLYVIWVEKLDIAIQTTDRYYMVAQDIELTEEEILKKVKVKDNLNSNYKYELKIIKIYDKSKNKELFNDSEGIGKGKLTEYLTTKQPGIYELTLYTENKNMQQTNEQQMNTQQTNEQQANTQQTTTMKVSVLSEKAKIEGVRFISKEYIDTLKAGSTWRQGKIQETCKS